MGLSQHGRGLEAEGLEFPRDPCVPEVGRENHVRSRSPNLGTLLHVDGGIGRCMCRNVLRDTCAPTRPALAVRAAHTPLPPPSVPTSESWWCLETRPSVSECVCPREGMGRVGGVWLAPLLVLEGRWVGRQGWANVDKRVPGWLVRKSVRLGLCVFEPHAGCRDD